MNQLGTIPRCAEDVVGPARMTVVAGSPIQVGDREIVPLVGVSSTLRRGAFVGQASEGACSRGVRHLRPIGVVERRSGRERVIPVRDLTSQILAGLTLAGLLVPVAVFVLTALSRSGRCTGRDSGPGV